MPDQTPEQIIATRHAQIMESAKANTEAAAPLFRAGVSAMIASLEDADPNRALEPAKIRFGIGLLAKAILSPGSVVLSDSEKARLDAALTSILTHLSNEAP